MIEVTKLNGDPVFINPHLLESVDISGDTRLLFISGKSLLIKQNKEEVLRRIISYRKQLGMNSQEI